MDKITFTVPSTLTSISHTKDRGLRIGFITQELIPKEKYAIIAMHQCFGYLTFSPNEIQEADLPKGEATQGKSKSKRLRNTLYCLWVKEGSKGSFVSFYDEKMERLIEHYKKLL
jgi:hypothetical protein